MVLDGFGWFRVVLGGFGWFRVLVTTISEAVTWSLGFGHPSRYQPRSTGLNFGEQTGTGVFPREQSLSVLLYILFKG